MSLNGNWGPGVALQLSPRWFQLDQQLNVVRTLAGNWVADVVIRNDNTSDLILPDWNHRRLSQFPQAV